MELGCYGWIIDMGLGEYIWMNHRYDLGESPSSQKLTCAYDDNSRAYLKTVPNRRDPIRAHK